MFLSISLQSLSYIEYFLKRTYTETNDWILLHMFRLVQNNKLIRTQLKSLPLISRVRSLKLT